MRGGRMVSVSIFDIVVGDVVPLNIGDQVPGDCVVISSQALTVDESSMTGESQPVSATWHDKLQNHRVLTRISFEVLSGSESEGF